MLILIQCITYVTLFPCDMNIINIMFPRYLDIPKSTSNPILLLTTNFYVPKFCTPSFEMGGLLFGTWL